MTCVLGGGICGDREREKESGGRVAIAMDITGLAKYLDRTTVARADDFLID